MPGALPTLKASSGLVLILFLSSIYTIIISRSYAWFSFKEMVRVLPPFSVDLYINSLSLTDSTSQIIVLKNKEREEFREIA